MFGNPGTLMPRYARGTLPHSSARVRPAAPVISIGATKSCVLKPVASTRTSAGRSAPSSVRMPEGVSSAMRSVTSSTLGLVRVGYQSSVSITRLQPTSSRGVTLARSSGSLIALLIWERPATLKKLSSRGLFVIAAAPNSMNQNTAARSSRWRAGKRANSFFVRSL